MSGNDHPHDHAHPNDHAHEHAPGPGHDHAHHRSPRDPREATRLRWVLLLTAAFMVVEAVGGVLAGSLALLADAGHMLTDVAALGMSLLAFRLARRPASWEKTYGYARIEILAALVNGVVLVVTAVAIAWEAWRRLAAPVEVNGPLMFAVAVAGLVANVVSAKLLHGHSHGSLNTRAAYLHVLGDLLGSAGAIAAGVIVWATGWTPADPIISVIISALIVGGSWRLMREAADVLLEGAPAHVDVERLMAELRDVPELHDIHDLHVWTLTSGFVALSAHGVIDDPYHHAQVLGEIRRRAGAHGIEHITFQLEPRPLVQVKTARER